MKVTGESIKDVVTHKVTLELSQKEFEVFYQIFNYSSVMGKELNKRSEKPLSDTSDILYEIWKDLYPYAKKYITS